MMLIGERHLSCKLNEEDSITYFDVLHDTFNVLVVNEDNSLSNDQQQEPFLSLFLLFFFSSSSLMEIIVDIL